jgi:casein kinase 1 epsilon
MLNELRNCCLWCFYFRPMKSSHVMNLYHAWPYFSQMHSTDRSGERTVERPRTSSRTGSASRRAIASSSRPGSSVEPSEQQYNRTSRLFSSNSGSRPSSTQRVNPSPGESRATSLSRAAVARGSRDEPLHRSLELLSLGGGKRK